MDNFDQLRQALSEPLPQPTAAERSAWASRAVDWSLARFAADTPIGLSATRAEMEALLREPPPEAGRDFADVFAEFEAKIVPHSFRIDHPRFLAFIPGAASFPALLGDWLCSAANFFAGVWLEASAPAQVELIVLDWFKAFLGCPDAASGLLTSGGSEANLTALIVARNRLPFADRRRAVLFASAQRHWSIDRAANVIGLHPDQIHAVPMDTDFRLTVAALTDTVQQERSRGRQPWLVVANAGATNTGTVDPLQPLADYCRLENLWFHVDAAYGWPAVLIPEGKHELAGIGAADSITFDPHKWFGQPFEAGGLLLRDGRLLEAAFALRPDYMQDVAPGHEEVNFCDRGIALTRRFRALKIWLSVKVLGVAWFRALVERGFRLAEYARQALARAGCFEILCEPRLSILCFRYVAPGYDEAALNRLNLKLLEDLRQTGQAFLSSTRLRERVAVRLCFTNWRTTAHDVDEVVRMLAQIGLRIAPAPRNGDP